MMRVVVVLLGLLACVTHAVRAEIVATSEIVGRLAGPGAQLAQPGLAFYGTDLGWTVEHDGRLVMLFGDTWPYQPSAIQQSASPSYAAAYAGSSWIASWKYAIAFDKSSLVRLFQKYRPLT